MDWPTAAIAAPVIIGGVTLALKHLLPQKRSSGRVGTEEFCPTGQENRRRIDSMEKRMDDISDKIDKVIEKMESTEIQSQNNNTVIHKRIDEIFKILVDLSNKQGGKT